MRRRMMLIVCSIQFTLATGHVITFLVQLIRAFIGAAGTLDGPSLYLLDQSTPEHVAQVALYITNVRFFTEVKIPHHGHANQLSFTRVSSGTPS